MEVAGYLSEPVVTPTVQHVAWNDVSMDEEASGGVMHINYFETPDGDWRQDPTRSIDPSRLVGTGQAVALGQLEGGLVFDELRPSWVASEITTINFVKGDPQDRVAVRAITAKADCPKCGSTIELAPRKAWAARFGVLGQSAGVKHSDDKTAAGDECERGNE